MEGGPKEMTDIYIWGYKDVKIEESGAYVRLVAPCGESRCVTPATARQIARDLLQKALEVELGSSHPLNQNWVERWPKEDGEKQP